MRMILIGAGILGILGLIVWRLSEHDLAVVSGMVIGLLLCLGAVGAWLYFADRQYAKMGVEEREADRPTQYVTVVAPPKQIGLLPGREISHSNHNGIDADVEVGQGDAW